MAKGKKKETLTPEERLQAALVPESEQPYKLPENWCWVKFGTVCKFENGYAFKSDQFTKNQGIPVIRISNIVDNSIVLDDCVYTTEINIDSKYIIDKGDLLIAMSGATTGKNGIYYSDKIAYLNQRVGNIKVINERVLNSFFRNFYILNIEQQILNLAYGGAQPNISSSKICDMSFPLPPLAEQQRIVERIESLFAKLDEAKQKAQDALDSFETRKAAILHKAFTGELTAQWRKEHSETMESWEEKTLQAVCSMKITDGTHKTPTYCDKGEGIPFISAKDVTTGKICWDNIKYITPDLHEELYARLAPQIDDILLAKNGTTGIAAIVETDRIFDLYVTLAVLRPDKQIIMPRYLLNIVNSPICKNQFNDHLTGIGVPNLHLRDIKAVIIKVPSIPEQTEIVRILDDLLAKEQQAKEAAEGVLEQIDIIKKAILARAFRGELGTNDPKEESAVELLKQVLSC